MIEQSLRFRSAVLEEFNRLVREGVQTCVVEGWFPCVSNETPEDNLDRN